MNPRVDPASTIVRLLLGLLLVAYFVVGLAYLGVRHYLWPRLDDWRPILVAELSSMLGQKVSLARLETGFEGAWPRLTVHDLRIGADPDHPGLSVARAVAVISPVSLFSGHLGLSVLQLDQPSLRVERLDARRFRVAGVLIDPDADQDDQGLALLLAQRRVLLHQARIDWIDHLSGRQTSIEAIELALGSVGRRHRGIIKVPAAAVGLEQLDFAFEIYRSAGVPASNWLSWSGELHAGMKGLDLRRVRQSLPIEPLDRATGRADLKVWLGLRGGGIADAVVRFSGSQLHLDGTAGSINAERLQFEASVKPDADGYLASLQQFELLLDDKLRLASSGLQQLSLDGAGRIVGGRIALAPFDAGVALDALRKFPLSSETARRLAALRLSGHIDALTASWSDSAESAFEASLDFRNLSVRYLGDESARDPGAVAGENKPERRAKDQRPKERVAKIEVSKASTTVRVKDPPGSLPWFENLSGEARILRDAGELRIRAKDGALGFPGVFAEPRIPLDEVQSEASWRIERAAASSELVVEVSRLQFANADASGLLSGSYRTGGKGMGLVDFKGSLSRARATRVARYLPLQIDSIVRDWVAKSILSGQAGRTEFVLRGDLEDFPFRDPASGQFLITADVRDTKLRYALDWPDIDSIKGQLRFERAGMRIKADAARVYGVSLSSVDARIDDFLKPTLRIAGKGTGPASDMLKFVNESPVATRIDDFTRSATALGPAQLDLQLQIPLENLDRSRLKGIVRFDGNDLQLDKTLPVLAGVSGTLEFTDEQLSLRDLSGTFLGGPVRVNGRTPEAGRFELDVIGRVTAQGMRMVSDNPLTQALDGSTDFRAHVEVRRHASMVTIESDLVGLSSKLPAPMNKSAEAHWPLRVNATPESVSDPQARPRRDAIHVQLGSAIRLLFEREREEGSETLKIRRGALALNAQPVVPEQGLAVILQTDVVDVDAWTPFLSDKGGAAGESGRPQGDPARGPGLGKQADEFSLMPQSVTLVTPKIKVGGKQLHDVVLGATRIGEFWNANIDSREVDGYFNWRAARPGQPIGELSARFSHLEIPRTQVREIENLLDAQPTALPALDVVAERFVLFERELGRLELQATNGTSPNLPGWRLDRLMISNPDAQLLATGNWTPSAVAGVRPTRMQFDLDLVDSGRLLDRFGQKGVMRNGPGKLSGTIHWLGSPLSIDYPSLGGNLVLDIGKGQFLKTDPGIAKLIGVLNLQSLPRRLNLDFRDVFAEGFSFDALRGDIGIAYGVARTSNLAMKGVQAQVRISGEADIERETQSLAVEVVPELNAGLASLAYGAMVNPVIGLGSFLAQLALSGPIQQMFTYEYDVKGSWADPQVAERRRPAQFSPATTQP